MPASSLRHAFRFAAGSMSCGIAASACAAASVLLVAFSTGVHAQMTPDPTPPGQMCVEDDEGRPLCLTPPENLTLTRGVLYIAPEGFLPLATGNRGSGDLLYTINALPDGLSHVSNPVGRTGTITGTPTTLQGPTTYMYTVTDEDTEDSVSVPFTIEVVEAAEGNITGDLMSLTTPVESDNPGVTTTGGRVRVSGLDNVELVPQERTGTYGHFSLEADGIWEYTLDRSIPATDALSEGEEETDEFTVVAAGDPDVTAVVTVTIEGRNSPPRPYLDLTSPFIRTSVGFPFMFDGTAHPRALDTPVIFDPEGETLTWTADLGRATTIDADGVTEIEVDVTVADIEVNGSMVTITPRVTMLPERVGLAFTVTATDPDGLSSTVRGRLLIDAQGGPSCVPNRDRPCLNPPADIELTVGEEFVLSTLGDDPFFRQADGGFPRYTYFLYREDGGSRENLMLPDGTEAFGARNAEELFFRGTPTTPQEPTTYVYEVEDDEGETASATFTVAVVAPTVTIGDATANEGGEIAFTVTLNRTVTGGLTVTPTYTDGTATSVADYTPNVDPIEFAGTDGETHTFTVATADDAIVEGNETFTVGLALSGTSIPVDVTAIATGTIVDDDTTAVTIGDATADEGGELTFTVTLNEAIIGGLTVTPTYPNPDAADTATPGDDYAQNVTPITFAGNANETQTFTVATTDDGIVEGAETFTVGLTVTGAAGTVDAAATATGTITDNDEATVTIGDVSATESGDITFTVTLGRAVEGGLTVTPTYPNPGSADSAVSGTDYTPNTDPIEFDGDDGETRTFTVATTDDAIVEGAETFIVGLTASDTTLPVVATDTATGTIVDDDEATITVEDVSATEGAGLTFTVTLNAAIQDGLTVTPTYTDGTASSPGDYTPNTATLTFAGTAGETETFTVATADDAIFEGNETFTVGLTASGAAGTVDATATATGTITDNDMAMVTIEDATAAEGSALTFTVTLDRAVEGGLTVTPTYPNPGSADTATSGTDYTPNMAPLTFAGTVGETRTFTVATTNDVVVEGSETFTVGLEVSGISIPVGMDDTATGTITDDDTAAVTVADVTAAEGGNLTFTVTLDRAVEGGLTVTPGFIDVSASSSADYTRNTTALDFDGTAGETRTFTVATADDDIVEASETFTVSLTVTGTSISVGMTDTATGTITDDDEATITVENMSATEGATLTFTVTLNAAVQDGLTVTPTYPGPDTATSGTDYTPNTAALTFTGTAGETQAFTVTTMDDAVVEDSETFTVGLTAGGTAGTVDDDDTATGTITDNDEATITVENMSATEGAALTFTVTLNAAVQGGLTVTPTYTDVTASSPGDYTPNTAPITFAGDAGETQTFTVTTTNDVVVEGDETFTVGLEVSGTSISVGMGDAATGTITDNDTAAVTIADVTAAEGGNLTFTVTLDTAVQGGLTVTPGFTAVTATTGTDYTPNTAALTFDGDAGETQTFMVATADDETVEASETFTVGLTAGGTAGTVDDDDTATGTITDDDTAAVTVENATAVEGTALTFTVTLDRAVQGGLTVAPDFTDGTATAGTDYTENTAALTFGGTAGETQMFTVETADDAVVEGPETFTVGLTVTNAAGTVVDDGTATGTITENDMARVTVADVTAKEGRTLTFTVTLDVAVQDGLTVTPTYTDGTATSGTDGTDYTPNIAPLTFLGTVGETQMFTVETADDAVVEGDETFTVGLTASGTPGTVDDDDTATGTINDNDVAAVTIADATAAEGGQIMFTVRLDRTVENGLTVTPTYPNPDGIDTATSGADYTQNTTAINFAGTAGETQTFMVATTDDDTVEDGEIFTVGLTVNDPLASSVDTTATATGTINDNDVAAVTIADATAAEGSGITFTVTLNAAVQGGLTVNPTYPGPDTATAGTDYTPNATPLTFAGTADETKTFTVATAIDEIVEDSETFTVGLEVSNAAGVVTMTDTAVGTITDANTAAVTIADATATEGGEITFTVTLNAAVQDGLTVTPTYTDVTASSPGDYTPNTAPITFAGAAGETKTFTVATMGDGNVEGDETFTVGLMVSATTPSVDATDTATGTIEDDDMARVTIEDVTAAEDGGLMFTVTLDLAVTGGLTVTPTYTNPDGIDTATSGADYTQNTTAINFAGTAGETQTFTVATTDDAIVEDSETFTVGLTVSSVMPSVMVIATDTATGKITDDDTAAVTIANATAMEGTGITFTVTLGAAVAGGLTVTPTYPGPDTATAGTDYTPNTDEISFDGMAGEKQTFTVMTTDDAILEGDETFTVGLTVSGTPLSDSVDATGTATGTIQNNDAAAVTIADVTATEGDEITFTVTLDTDVQSGLTVTPTYPNSGGTDTATAGTDYTQNTAPITFNGDANETQTFTVRTTEDAILEGAETFTVGLTVSNTPHSDSVDATDTAIGTIADDDTAAVTVEDVATNEGGALTFTVTLDVAVAGGLTVTPTYPNPDDDTAASGDDYMPNTTALTFDGDAGEMETFTVTTTDDAILEGTETFTVGLAVSGTSVPVGMDDTATGTIADNDAAAVTVEDVAAAEGGALTFTVTLGAAVAGGLTVTPIFSGDSAAANDDYTPNAGPLIFAGTAGETQAFTVETTDDAVVEGTETFTVGLAVSGTSVPVGMDDTATGTITDNDTATLTIADMSATEGGGIMFTVTLDTEVQGGVMVTPTYTGGTATAGTDYTENTEPLSFAGTAGETETFTVATTGDAIVEGDEAFTVGLTVTNAAGTVVATDTAVGTIEDNDNAQVTIANAMATEGSGLTFTVRLDSAVAGGLTVTPTYPNPGDVDTATSGADYTPHTAALAFTGTVGETHMFTVATTNDVVAEGAETFTVGLAVSGTPVSVGTGAAATGTIADNDTATLAIANATAAEGGSLAFTVTLDVAVAGGLMVTPTYTDGTATSDTDYTRNTAALAFAGTAGETQTFTVMTADDDIVEGDETFAVNLTVTDAAGTVDATSTATGTITDNDTAALAIAAGPAATEGASVTFTVTLDTAVQGGLTVTPTYTDVTATAGTDYTRNTTPITFTGTAGEMRTFTVMTTDDAVVEGNETFTVGLTANGTTPSVMVIATDTATGTIADNDTATLAIAAEPAVTEGTDITFTVTLDAAVAGGITVTPTYTDVTAAAGADYMRNTAPLTFTGSGPRTFTVATTDDAIVEGAETFTVGLAVSGTAIPVGMDATATGTIADNDTAAVTVENATAVEGTGIVFTVTLDTAVQGGLTVTPTYPNTGNADTATAGTDYTQNTAGIAFAGTAGETETFTVATTDDDDVEGAETFIVGLTASGAAGTVTMTDTATGTIADNDAATLTIGDVTVTEGNGLTFTVTLDTAVQGGLTVTPDYTAVTATAGTDYTENTAALTFDGTAGETETFMVATTDDAIVEGSETFIVSLTASGSDGTVQTTDTATGTIADNDTATLAIAAGPATVEEGGTLTFTVTLDVAVAGGLTVTPAYPNSGNADTATSDADYTPHTAALAFAGTAGETATFTIATADDAIVESAETFTVGLAVSGTSIPVGMDATATGTITDNDMATLTIGDIAATEGEGVTFTVTLDTAVEGGLTVALSYPNPGNADTATAGTDYTQNTAGIAFAGDAAETQEFTVATTDDAIVEDTETFTVGLTASGAAGTVVATDTATGTIEDNDTAMVTIADVTATEGTGITFTVTLDAAVAGGLTVTPTYPNPGNADTATAGADYTENAAALTFDGTAGETETFTVATMDDETVESDETFTVGLMVTDAAGTVVATDTATGTIADNDDSMVTIGDVTATEGDTLTFTVTLGAAVQGGLDVTPTIPPGTADTAIAGTDYTPNTDTLMFDGDAGETQTFTIETMDDAVVEGDETFTVGLIVADAAGTVQMMDTATGTIADDDAATLTVGNVTAAEGGGLMFTVTLDTAVQGGLTVTPTYTDVTATAGDDYTQNTGVLTFDGTAGETKTFTVATADDDDVENAETFTVGLMRVGATSGTVDVTDTATGTITDNDEATLTIADVTENEDTDLTFTVTLDTAVQGGLMVTPGYTDVTATAGDDYTQNTAAIAFTGTAGETRMFTVMVADDAVVENAETFTVGLSVTDAAGTVDATDTATGTIEDNDTATLTIADVTENMTAREGADFTFEVTLDTAVQGGLMATPTYPNPGGADTATAGDDYTQNTAAIAFAGTAGETRTFTVTARDDDLVEGDETFTVGLSVSGAAGTVETGDPATGMITDADAATVTVEDVTVTEGGTFTFTVTLDLAVVGGLMVTPGYTDVTATEGTDYTANTAAIAFTGTAGETRTFTVATMPDAVAEGDETFTVGLTASGATGTVGDADTATGRIDDDDTATLTVGDVTAAEGGPLAFTVTLDTAVQGGLAVTPAYTDVTATAGADYTANTAAIAFAGTVGETQTFTVMTTDDAIVEGTETFTVGLTASGTMGTVVDTATATGTITDDDDSTVTVEDMSATEGDGIAFTVTLGAAVQGGLTVTPTYLNPGDADTATPGDDYTPNIDAIAFAGAAGETRTFTVATTDDAIVEGDETFTVGLMVTDAAGTVAMTDTATGTIENDDTATLAIADASAVEGEDLSFTVTLDAEVDGGLTATPVYTDVTATAGDDYTPNADVIAFDGVAGETRTFVVPTAVDGIAERSETFTIALTAGGTPHPVDATATATGTIADDDTTDALNLVILPEVIRAIADQVNNAIGRRLAGAGDDGDGAALRLGGQPASTTALASRGRTMAAARDNGIETGIRDVLGDSGFVLPLKADGAGSPVLSLWGNGDWRHLGGRERRLDWDGDLFSAHLGLDARLGDDVLAGVALAWNDANMEYDDADPGTGIGRGDYELDTVGAYPYLGWNALSGKLDLWVTAGIGEGELTITPRNGTAMKSDVRLRTAGAGVNGQVLQTDDLVLRLKAEALQTEMDVKGNDRLGEGRIARLDVEASRLRLASEASHTRLLENGWRMGSSAELGVRYDGGDGRTGEGAEVGLGLRFGNPASGVTVEGKARGLVAHNGDYEDWGLQGLVRLDPDARGRGLSFSVSPGYGEAKSGVEDLWRQGLRRGEDSEETDDRDAGMRFDASVGWGIATLSGNGLVTPYMGLSLADENERSYRAGVRFEAGSAFSMDLEVEDRDARADGKRIMLRSRIANW